METFLIKAFQLIVALSLLVVVHEFGHYIFARMFGIRVEKFYMFFNPRFSLMRYVPEHGRLEFCTWMDKQSNPHSLVKFNVGQDYQKTGNKVPAWKKTIYGIGWVPLGGYCAIAGMIDETQDASKLAAEPQSWEFRTKPAWQRLLVMTGGVLFNFLFAVIIYIGITFSWGERGVKFRDAYAGMEYAPTALAAGFQNGDIPLMADGKEVEADQPNVLLTLAQAKVVTVLRNQTDTVDIALPNDFMLNLNEDKGFFAYRQPVVISKTLNGEPAQKAGLTTGDRVVSVGEFSTPSFKEFKAALDSCKGKTVELQYIRNGATNITQITPTSEGLVGVNIAPITEIYPVYVKEYGFFEAIPAGWRLGTSTLTEYVKSLGQVFSKKGAQQLGGFGALGSMFPDMWNWESFWFLTALLSVVLAVMNILPIPALDGGHVLFLLYEVITRRRPSEKFLEYAQSIGFFLLLALLLFANLNDVIRFFK